MEIPEIKQRLDIETVLAHYGLKPDKNNRLLCPFHDDKTPSLQIYPKTNTFCCFSTSCSAGTGDVIQLIGLMEKCSKHEALVKAATLAGGNQPSASEQSPAKLFIETDILVKEAVLAKLFKYFAKALPLTKKAVDYLSGRLLDYKLHEVGYNTGDWHHKLNEKNFIRSCEQYGLLKPLPAQGHAAWARDCIIFPLKNEGNKIVSLYGRSIINNDDSRHFYLSGRAGLYPGYPKLSATKLILTESIIDAASLLEQKEIRSGYEVLALYGTNGLTEEHLKAIGSLPQLEEIILMLNADEPGEAATAKHYKTFKELLPLVKISKVELPAGEDVNSVLCAHDDAKVLIDLIEQRKQFFVSLENKKSIILGVEKFFERQKMRFPKKWETVKKRSVIIIRLD